MDRLILNGTDGFPLYTDTLAEAQKGWSVFNGLTGLAGDLAIIKGCEVNGTNVANGFVSIAGELYYFKGGALGANVFIKEVVTNREFKDKSTKPVYMERYATFGSSTPDKTFAWSDFKRVDNLIEQGKKNIDFEARIKKLEEKPLPIPLGLVAIWNKPADVPIPTGWQECTDLRGRFPYGWDPDVLPSEFNKVSTIGSKGGEAAHVLTVDEMPSHSFNTVSNSGGTAMPNSTTPISYWGDPSSNGSDWNYSLTAGSGEASLGRTNSIGGNQAHNNLPPYRVIRFIEFIGF